MGTGITITRKDFRKLDDLIAKYPEKVETLGRVIAQGIVNDVVLSFGTSPAGNEYRRGRRVHVASQPNYPPNIDTGTLRASIRWEQQGRHRFIVMDGVVYGIHLEDGTERMAPRPFMQPAFYKWRGREIEREGRRILAP